MERQGEAPGKTLRLLEQVRQVMRLHHYSLPTERAYVDWIKRYVRFHRMQRREDLAGGEAKIEAFLTDLAVNGGVASATQNQAMNALVLLYKQGLEVPLDTRNELLGPGRRVALHWGAARRETGRPAKPTWSKPAASGRRTRGSDSLPRNSPLTPTLKVCAPRLRN
jgi:hypothetical protein